MRPLESAWYISLISCHCPVLFLELVRSACWQNLMFWPWIKAFLSFCFCVWLANFAGLLDWLTTAVFSLALWSHFRSEGKKNALVHAILSLCCRGCADCMAFSLLLAATCSDGAHVCLVAVGTRTENSKNMLCLSLSSWLVDLCFVSSPTWFQKPPNPCFLFQTTHLFGYSHKRGLLLRVAVQRDLQPQPWTLTVHHLVCKVGWY